MSDTHAPAEPRSADAKLQGLARNMLAALYMLVRSVKLYDPENAVFQKPLNALLETINQIIAKEGKLDLAVVNGSFYVNGQLVRLEATSVENMKYLVGELENRKVGGFGLQRPTTIGELRNFIWIFAKDQNQEPDEDGVAGRKLTAMRLTRWAKLKEKLDKLSEDGKVDRKKYALTLYARAVFFVNETIKAMREGRAPEPNKAVRLVQDLIDVSRDHGSQFLGMTCAGVGEEGLSYHLVNTALIAITFGGELGMSKSQLKDLGLAALFNEIGLWQLPVEYRLRLQPERLPPEIQRRLVAIYTDTARQVLAEPDAGRLHFLRGLSCIQMHQSFGKPVRDARGRIRLVMPGGDPLFFSRILAIASYYDILTSTTADHEAFGPAVALDLMWNQERHRFDPELLRVFIAVMARQPIKMLSPTQGRIDIAGV